MKNVVLYIAGGGMSVRANSVNLPIHGTSNCATVVGARNNHKRLCAGFNGAGVGICQVIFLVNITYSSSRHVCLTYH